MRALVSRFAKDESGATAVEYGVIVAGIAVAIMVTVDAIGGSLKAMFADAKLTTP